LTAARGDGSKRVKPTPGDVVAGLVTGLFSIPEGVAYASIAGSGLLSAPRALAKLAQHTLKALGQLNIAN
jgi:hypothetical protein